MFSKRKRQPASTRCFWWFSLLVLASLMVGWRTLLALFSLASTNDAYTHILLIVPIAASLIYLAWPASELALAPGSRTGFAFLFVAMMLAGFSKWRSNLLAADAQLSIFTFALVLWWIGAIIVSFGVRFARALLFPLCFLLWLVPLPSFVLNAIVNWLQHGSADAAQFLFGCVGVPVAQDGIRLTIPGLTVEVAQECSSIRSSMILLVTTMVVAQVFLNSAWRKAVVIGMVIPLSLAKNGFRIFTIAMLGTRVDPGFLTGKLHHNGGVIFLAIALGVIFLVLWLLREDKTGKQDVALRPIISSAPK